MSRQSVLRTLGKLEVPKYAVKKSEYQIIPIPDVMKTWCWDKAKKVAKRQVLNLGESFPEPIPILLQKWKRENGFNHYNAMTIEIYDNISASIGWRKHPMKHLSYEYITMCSFALEKEDTSDLLCKMEFDKMLPPIRIRHQTCLTFNAHVHNQLGIRNRVNKHFRGRMNIILYKIMPENGGVVIKFESKKMNL